MAAQFELYEYLRSRLSDVPAILLKLGMPVPEAAAACEGLDILIGRWILDFNPDLVSDHQAPSPDPNYVDLARQLASVFRRGGGSSARKRFLTAWWKYWASDVLRSN